MTYKEAFWHPTPETKINARSIIGNHRNAFFMFTHRSILEMASKGTHIQLPTFVWCLFTGVIIRNSLTHLFQIPSG